MTLEVETGFKIDFGDAIYEAIQQKMSKFKPLFDVVTINGEYRTIDDIGVAEFIQNDSYLAPTDLTQETEYNRRRVSAHRFLCDRVLDKNVVADMVASDAYMRKVAAQIANDGGRVIDRVIVSAFENDAYDEDNAAITFAADGGISVDATAGFTFESFDEAKKELEQLGFGIEEISRIMFATTPQERNTLESQNQIANIDYSNGYGVTKDANGNLLRVRGVELITYASHPQGGVPAILPVATGTLYRKNYMFNAKSGTGTQSAITVGMQKDLSIDLIELKEGYHDAWLLKGSLKLGATRNANSGIVAISTQSVA